MTQIYSSSRKTLSLYFFTCNLQWKRGKKKEEFLIEEWKEREREQSKIEGGKTIRSTFHVSLISSQPILFHSIPLSLRFPTFSKSVLLCSSYPYHTISSKLKIFISASFCTWWTAFWEWEKRNETELQSNNEMKWEEGEREDTLQWWSSWWVACVLDIFHQKRERGIGTRIRTRKEFHG